MNVDGVNPPPLQTIAWCWILAVAIVVLNFALEGRLDINMADEGFFYYGVLRVRAGEIPMADFQSYEPYRYYWAAAWTWLIGDSLYAVRGSTAFFGALGLAAGLSAIARVVRSPWQLALIGVAISWSTVMWFRVFETAVALIAIWVAVKVSEQPTRLTTFAAGIVVGLIAGVGRNHGVYCAVAILVVIVVVTMHSSNESRIEIIVSYFAGIVIGYIPIVVHIVFVPHYFSVLWKSILRILASGSTNIPLPVPWPWRISVQGLLWQDAVRILGVAILFLAIPLTYVLAVVLLLFCFIRNDPAYRLLLAAAAVGIPYLQLAFSRADEVHLLDGGQAFIPTVVALLALAETQAASIQPRVILITIILPAYLLVNAMHLPRTNFMRSPKDAYTAVDANGSTLMLPKPDANAINTLQGIKASVLKSDDALFVAPYWPMAYALLRKRSPIWEIYLLFPRTEAFQREEIADLERQRVKFAIYADIPLDGRDDLRMSVQQPLLYQYLVDNYVLLNGPALPVPYRLYRRATPFRSAGTLDNPDPKHLRRAGA